MNPNPYFLFDVEAYRKYSEMEEKFVLNHFRDYFNRNRACKLMSSADDPPVEDSAFNLDFRSYVDDAWYTSRVLLNGHTLTVKLQDFPQTIHDEVFNPGDFATPEAVDEFRRRFRPLSKPLEDSECSKVVQGTTICATFKEDGQVRFFDAIVEAVNSAEHSPDRCTCTFLLYWEQGPEEGNVTATNIADICLLCPGKLDSRVDCFINISKDKIGVASQRTQSVSSEISLSKGLARTHNSYSPTKSKSSSSGHKLQENEKARQYDRRGSTSGVGRGRKCCQQSDQDEDLGGRRDTGDHLYIIIIENLEKDLSPSSVQEFIHKHTSVTPQAYVFLSLSSESCARGAIFLDCKKKLVKVYEFLKNPNHFIVSLTGRPWVIVENMPRTGTFKMPFGSLLPTSQYISQGKDIDSKLKVVHSGTEEYKRAKLLWGLFDEFHNHLNGLRKRLVVEEKRLLQPFNGV